MNKNKSEIRLDKIKKIVNKIDTKYGIPIFTYNQRNLFFDRIFPMDYGIYQKNRFQMNRYDFDDGAKYWFRYANYTDTYESNTSNLPIFFGIKESHIPLNSTFDLLVKGQRLSIYGDGYIFRETPVPNIHKFKNSLSKRGNNLMKEYRSNLNAVDINKELFDSYNIRFKIRGKRRHTVKCLCDWDAFGNRPWNNKDWKKNKKSKQWQ